MRIGPITISIGWTKTITEAAAESQRLWLRRQRCIVGMRHDLDRCRSVIAAMAEKVQQRREQVKRHG